MKRARRRPRIVEGEGYATLTLNASAHGKGERTAHALMHCDFVRGAINRKGLLVVRVYAGAHHVGATHDWEFEAHPDATLDDIPLVVAALEALHDAARRDGVVTVR